MGKTVTKGSSVKYGSGQYDKTAHSGGGKAQKLRPPAVGTGYDSPTPHASGAIARDGVEGHGSKKRGYQIDAHSGLYHGRQGEAVGHRQDLRPMDYSTELHGEGGHPIPDGHGPSHLQKYDHANKGTKVAAHPLGMSNKAEHHPPASKTPHEFTRLPSKEAHGYGHQGSQRDGWLRSSGHSKGHQIGKR